MLLLYQQMSYSKHLIYFLLFERKFDKVKRNILWLILEKTLQHQRSLEGTYFYKETYVTDIKDFLPYKFFNNLSGIIHSLTTAASL